VRDNIEFVDARHFGQSIAMYEIEKPCTYINFYNVTTKGIEDSDIMLYVRGGSFAAGNTISSRGYTYVSSYGGGSWTSNGTGDLVDFYCLFY
jgi:hypothetical protein